MDAVTASISGGGGLVIGDRYIRRISRQSRLCENSQMASHGLGKPFDGLKNTKPGLVIFTW